MTNSVPTLRSSALCAPVCDLRCADVGDVPFASRFRLEQSLDDIEAVIDKVMAAGVVPLSVGGDHSITYPIMKALGRERPLGMVHIDAQIGRASCRERVCQYV